MLTNGSYTIARDDPASPGNIGGGPVDIPSTAEAPTWNWRFFGRAETAVERAYLVRELLPERGVGLIAGQWGTYKTFVALDLAAAVVTGTPFAGFDVVRRGAPLFVSLEGQAEVDVRFGAALAHRGWTDDIAPFAWIDDCPRLLDKGAGAALAAMVEQAAERMRQDHDLPVVLVIVDTAGKAARYERAGDENDAVLGRHVVAAMEEASRKTGALFLGIDHFGKSAETGTRGSSAKEADCDVVLALLGDKAMTGTVTNPRLAIRKRRGGANGVEILFRTPVVETDTGTTLVIDWGQPRDDASVPKPELWPKSLRLFRTVLMDVLVDRGTTQHPFPDGPAVRAVELDAVRDEFGRRYPAEGDAKKKADARRLAFKRAVATAQSSGLIGVLEVGETVLVWPAKDA